MLRIQPYWLAHRVFGMTPTTNTFDLKRQAFTRYVEEPSWAKYSPWVFTDGNFAMK